MAIAMKASLQKSFVDSQLLVAGSDLLRRGNASRVSVPGLRSLGLAARPLKLVVAAESSDAVAATAVESAPTVPKPSPLLSSCTETVPDSEVSITKTSFGTIGLVVGVFLLSYGFGGYFQFLPGSEWSALMLTYGFPLTIIGFALKYAELKPVECESMADAVALREKQATDILTQVRSDVTRFRYGDEQHLEEALKRIFRYNLQGGIQRRNAPTLVSIAEQVYDGSYSLLLVFEAAALKLQDFESRQAKFSSFFGPNVNAVIEDFGPNKYGVRLVSLQK